MKSEDVGLKRRKASKESISDGPTEPWDFDPNKEEFKELKDIKN